MLISNSNILYCNYQSIKISLFNRWLSYQVKPPDINSDVQKSMKFQKVKVSYPFFNLLLPSNIKLIFLSIKMQKYICSIVIFSSVIFFICLVVNSEEIWEWYILIVICKLLWLSYFLYNYSLGENNWSKISDFCVSISKSFSKESMIKNLQETKNHSKLIYLVILHENKIQYVWKFFKLID